MSVVTGHARTIQETRAISDQGLDTIIDRAFDETSWNGIVRRGREGLGGHSLGLSLVGWVTGRASDWVRMPSLRPVVNVIRICELRSVSG